MTRENYDQIRALVSKIDELSSSSDSISEILDSVKKNGGNSKFFVHTNRENSTTELPQKPTEKVCEEILKTYHTLIKKYQEEMNSIIDSLTSGCVYADTEV